MTEMDDFSPEDVFKLFPTAYPMGPKPKLELPAAPETSGTPNSSALLEEIFNPQGTWIFGEAEDVIILPILLSVIGFFSLLGNGFVVCVILGFRRMRTGSNLLLLNIATSDLVFIIFTIPTSIINHATPGGVGGLGGFDPNGEPPGVQLCKFVHYVLFVTVYVSIYSLMVGCVFRFFSDCMSSKSNSLLSRGNAIISSVVVWLAFLVSHLNFLVQPGGAVFQQPFICVHDTEALFADADQTKIRTLWVTFLACGFLLPLITICTLSAIVLHRQANHKPHRDAAHAQYESAQNEANERRNRRELSVLIMAAMVTRAVCWLPIQIFVMLDIFGMSEITEVYRKAEMLGVCCAFAATCVNPLLYNCMSLDFRLAYHEAFRKMGCNCSEEKHPDDFSDMNETIMSIISDSSNHINYN